MKDHFIIIFICIVSISIESSEKHIDIFGRHGINLSGSRSLLAEEFGRAVEEILQDTASIDSGFRFFKLGLAHAGLKNFGKASFYFRLVSQVDSQLAPFAFEKIGDIEYEQMRIENALVAYRAAADASPVQRYRYYIYDKMYKIATKHVGTIGAISWLEEVIGILPGLTEIVDTLPVVVRSLIDSAEWNSLDTQVSRFFDSTGTGSGNSCWLCTVITPEEVPESLFSGRVLFLLSENASECNELLQASDWLQRAVDRKDFNTTVSIKEYMFFRGELNYKLKNYNKAVRWLKKYVQEFGPVPSILYMIARSYRALGKGEQATRWYDEHVKLFPHHQKTHDILWYRAWEEEEKGNFNAAREFYSNIFIDYKQKSKADDSYFRYALSFYKEKDCKAAFGAFSEFIKRYPESSMAQAAKYWKAKCRFSLKDIESARKEFVEIAGSDPTTYYAYRAREMLTIIGDTTIEFSVDTLCDFEKTIFWLDSVSGEKTKLLSHSDSTAFIVGIMLASTGLICHAEMLFEPLETCFPQNLLLQFELALLYESCDLPWLTYRVARQLTWRIPRQHRSEIPCIVYRYIYPRFYLDAIEKYADTFTVSPELVISIIRQESIFDPAIVSPVGAVGLMQIMPYTGEDIAKRLNEPFSVDSLYNPTLNIRFGTYYISHLLEEFDGNVLLAVAGYNGGPHNVKKWYERNKEKEFDMFVEDIGFSETRNYAKKVLANYWTYQKFSSIPGFYSQ